MHSWYQVITKLQTKTPEWISGKFIQQNSSLKIFQEKIKRPVEKALVASSWTGDRGGVTWRRYCAKARTSLIISARVVTEWSDSEDDVCGTGVRKMFCEKDIRNSTSSLLSSWSLSLT